jgi:hypothetical protein
MISGRSSGEELLAGPPPCTGDPWPDSVHRFLTANEVRHRFKAMTGQKLTSRKGINDPREWVVLSTNKSFSAVERALDINVLTRGCSSYVPWLLRGSVPGPADLLWHGAPLFDRKGYAAGSCSFGSKRYPHSNLVVVWTGVECKQLVDTRWMRFDHALRRITSRS